MTLRRLRTWFACGLASVLVIGCGPARDSLPSVTVEIQAGITAPPPGASLRDGAAVTPTGAPPRPALPPGKATPAIGGSTETGPVLQTRVFDRVWTLVNTRYVYPDFNGADWTANYTPTLARIRAGMSPDAFYEMMYGLVDSLADGHTYFLSPDDAVAHDKNSAGDTTFKGFGFSYEVADTLEYVYVLQTHRDGPADKAGIRPHDHILKINGAPAIDPAVGDLADVFFDERVISATLTVQTPGGKPRQVGLSKAQITDTVQIDAKLLPGKKRIGYLAIPSFDDDDVADSVRRGLRDLMKGGVLDGLIVDLRLNEGGSLDAMTSAIGLFAGGPFGTLLERTGRGETLSARPESIGNSQSIPLAILTGWRTASAGEIMAGALQAKKRARVFGQTTEGNIETILAHDLPDGSVLWLAEQRFTLPNGKSWEGSGLTPDVPIDAEWDTFSEAADPYVKAAQDFLSR